MISKIDTELKVFREIKSAVAQQVVSKLTGGNLSQKLGMKATESKYQKRLRVRDASGRTGLQVQEGPKIKGRFDQIHENELREPLQMPLTEQQLT